MSLWLDMFVINEAPNAFNVPKNEFAEDASGGKDNSESVADEDSEQNNEMDDTDSTDNEMDEQSDDTNDDMDANPSEDAESDGDPSMDGEGTDDMENADGEMDETGDEMQQEPEETLEEKEHKLSVFNTLIKIEDVANNLLNKCFESDVEVDSSLIKQINEFISLIDYYKTYKFDSDEIENAEKIVKDSIKVLERLSKDFFKCCKAYKKDEMN